jgi:hypothetical protein
MGMTDDMKSKDGVRVACCSNVYTYAGQLSVAWLSELWRL